MATAKAKSTAKSKAKSKTKSGAKGSTGRNRPQRTREWDAFERRILDAAPKGSGSTQSRGTTGVDTVEADVLRRLAERSRIIRSRSAPLGNVVFLHGITGSDLAVSRGFGRPDNVWVSIINLALGQLEKLCLAEDGARESDGKLQVRPTGLNKRFYGRAILALRARWNVEPFAYDWRKDIDEASSQLAAFIRDRFRGEPVHLVAHSMGGLVARNFISKHRELWASMKDPALRRGGRLVMLGTPNYGSYAIVQVMNGTDAMLTRLQRFDLKHDMKGLLRITNSFPGTYQLLPAFSKLPPEQQRIYEGPTWGSKLPVSQRHLDRAYQFHSKLDTPANTDPERLLYVAGVNQSTIAGVKVLSPGQFDYEFTRDGDGRVPLALGLLPDVPTWYIDELHGDLARNETVLFALDELLQTGATRQLASTPQAAIAGRGAVADGSARAYRAADRAALDLLGELSSRARQAGEEKVAQVLSKEEQQLAADAILDAALSARLAVAARYQDEEKKEQPGSGTRPRPSVTLRVGVRYGSIVDFKAPLLVVGHYRGVRPVNAIGAIDERLDGWLARAVRRGMISGQVGETYFVPTRRQLAADGVIVAGMGDYGAFKKADIRRIMANVAQGAAALGTRQLGSVLIGAGDGGLPVEVALREVIEGFSAGIIELFGELDGNGGPRKQGPVPTLWIVEISPQRVADLRAALASLAKTGLSDGVNLKVAPTPAAELSKARRAAVAKAKRMFDSRKGGSSGGSQKFNEIRITIESGPDRDDGVRDFTISALTDNAVVPVQKIEVPSQVMDNLARRLSESESKEQQQRYGRMLFRYLMPREFESLFEGDAAVRLVVDPASAAFPWEMACLQLQGSGRGFEWFGVERRVTRQFRSLLSGFGGLAPVRGQKLRALVIADPAPEPDWQLPGARTEGSRVASLLRFANGKELDFSDGPVKLDIEVDSFIGYQQCEPLDLIARVTSGDYDLIHFAGHGIYAKDEPAKSGWVLSSQHFVTPRDIARSRQTPWLVFANACFSGVVNSAAESQPIEEARRAASIAEIFMQLGVRNYLGTGWAVDDAQATDFALRFYAAVLSANSSMADTLEFARDKVRRKGVGSTWGAYQFYGNPSDRLQPRKEGLGMGAAEKCCDDFEEKGT